MVIGAIGISSGASVYKQPAIPPIGVNGVAFLLHLLTELKGPDTHLFSNRWGLDAADLRRAGYSSATPKWN